MHAPAFSLHRQQISAQRLPGMCDTLVIGSIFSGFPMLTCRETCHQSPVDIGVVTRPSRGYIELTGGHFLMCFSTRCLNIGFSVTVMDPRFQLHYKLPIRN